MPILHETLDTRMPRDEAFAFVADFSNAAAWDPGVAWSRRLGAADDPATDVGLGSRFALGIRMAGRIAPMEYAITTWQPPHRVVLTGRGSGVEAVDDIRFHETATGTRVDYTADIRLRGPMRLLAPFAGRAFASIAQNARDGMRLALDERASTAR
jgi:carbon monoxide dehydrogenase subunit G